MVFTASLMKSSKTPRASAVLVAIKAALIAFVLLLLLHTCLPAFQVLDLTLQASIHGWTDPTLTRIMQALTFIGSIKVFVPTLIVALTILFLTGSRQNQRHVGRKREVVTTFAIGIGGSMILNESFKLIFHRARPHVPWAIGSEPTFSFPSGHALFALVLYGLIFYSARGSARPSGRPKVVILTHLPLLALSMLLISGVGLSRIYLGMHWPTDVLAGYITGACWLAATIDIDQRLHPH